MKPETVGLSASRLARLDDVMKRRYVDSGRLPGVLTMVYRRGKLAHTGMSGSMDLERDKPMREDAIFRIYSMTKPITAAALMMLVEEGLIGLDDDARPCGTGARAAAYEFGGWVDQPSSHYAAAFKKVDLAHTSVCTYGFMNRTM